MSIRGLWRRHVSVRFGLIAVAVVILGAGASTVLAGDDDGDAPSLSPSDIDAIGSVIETWNESMSLAWPSSPAVTEMSVARAEAVNDAYREAVLAVGTPEFVERWGSFDLAAYEELQRQEAPESVCLAHEVETLRVKPLLQQDDGDVIVEVMVWQGWTAGEVDATAGEVVRTYRIDQTPVHVYAVRKTDLGWRIAAEYRYYQQSADADMDQYGPNTPHEVRPPTSEWRVD